MIKKYFFLPIFMLFYLGLSLFAANGNQIQDKSVSCYPLNGKIYKTVSYNDFKSITLRGESLDIEITVVQNFWEKENTKEDFSVVLIPDMAHTSVSLKTLAASFTRDKKLSGKNVQIFILNMPGHRNSGFPKDFLYSNISLNDYISTVQQLLDTIKVEQDIDMILGQGTGALLTQYLQDNLIKDGSSLYNQYGIKNALLLSSHLPGNIEWQAADSGILNRYGALFTRQDDNLGNIIDINAKNWQSLFYSSQLGIITGDAPTTDIIEKASLNAPEPLKAFSEILGINGFIRRPVDYGIFNSENGTTLTVVTLNNGKIASLEEQRTLYLELTGDSKETNFSIISTKQSYQDYTAIKTAPVLKIVKPLLFPSTGEYTGDNSNASRGLASNSSPGTGLAL